MKFILKLTVIAAVFTVILPGCTTAPEAKICVKDASPLKVSVYVGNGAKGIGCVEWCRLVNECPQMRLKLVDGNAVAAGALEGEDVVVMPGGDSKAEFTSLTEKGVEKFKEFILNGGGYVGTCAGCSILLNEEDRRLKIVPYKRLGSTKLLNGNFKITKAGAEALGIAEEPRLIRYSGGPIIKKTENEVANAKFEVFGTYDFEASTTGRANTEMFGAPAILGGTYGKGKVFTIVAHPEYFEETLDIVEGAFKFVSGRNVKFPPRMKKKDAVAVGFLTSYISGIETAETALAIDNAEDMYLVPVDVMADWRRQLDHINVLVLPNDIIADQTRGKNGKKLVEKFMSRGGTVIGFGSAVKVLPKGAIPSGSREEIVKTIRSL